MTRLPRLPKLSSPCCIDRHASREDPLCHYIVVRDDLPLGLLAAQVTHAAGESSPGNLPHGTHAVVLGVPPDRLQDVAARLTSQGVSFETIVEDTAPWAGQTMALGLRPGPKSIVGRFLADLPLLRSKGGPPD